MTGRCDLGRTQLLILTQTTIGLDSILMFGMYQMNDELEVVSEMREDELWWFTICVSRLKFANCEFSVQYLRSPSHTSPSQSPDCPPKVKSSFIFPSTAACRSQYRLFEEYVIPQRQEQIEFCLSYIPLFVFIFSPSSIYLPRGFWRESVRSVGLMQGQRVVWSQQGSWVTCLPSALTSGAGQGCSTRCGGSS